MLGPDARVSDVPRLQSRRLKHLTAALSEPLGHVRSIQHLLAERKADTSGLPVIDSKQKASAGSGYLVRPGRRGGGGRDSNCRAYAD